MPADQGGDPSAFLPAAEPVEHVHHKSYADYLREAQPSKHEVKPHHRHDEAATVQAAIERVKAIKPYLRRGY